MKIHLSIIFTLALCLLGAVQNITACNCDSLTVRKQFDQSTLIFSGKVIGYRKDIPNSITSRTAQRDNSTDEALTVDFEVDKWWKGKLAKKIFLIQGATHFSKGSSLRDNCAFHFDVGKTYLVYASGQENNFLTDYCARTMEFAKTRDDLKFLGEGQLPQTCPRIIIDEKEPIDPRDDNWMCSARLINAATDLKLSYQWTYYRGGKELQIKAGQGTKSITIGGVDLNLGISVFVEVRGLPAGCDSKAGISVIS